jgi:hypothetical protein
VWDNNNRTLLAREAIPPTNEPLTVFFPLTVPPGPPGPRGYSGLPPFKVQRVPPVPGQSLEIRVWTAGGSFARVYQLSLARAQQSLSTGG